MFENHLRKKFSLLTLLFIFLISLPVEAMPEIMPADQIKSGMKGIAYTVIDNSGIIRPFNVDIIGLMDNGKGSTKMIMAKASGEVINQTGGVLQGMSGSPVYVNGKLIGALAASIKETDPYTFFITPIEPMLSLWNLPDPKAQNKFHSVDLKTEDNSSPTPTENIETQIQVNKHSNLNLNLNQNLYLNRFDRFKYLSNELNSYNLYSSASNSNEVKIDYDAKLEPGSAVGVAVVCGDFAVGATGTVTAVDGKKILAFGHSFTHAGNVNFFMTDASIVGTINGEGGGSGLKVANVGNIIGRINQDREAGVAGIVGSFPSVVPITINIEDKSRGLTETYNSSIAYNENLIPRLGAALSYVALSKTSDSLAESTVDVNFAIKTNAIKSGKLERKNMFYNTSDVGQVAVIELLQALELVCSNTSEESDIFGINVDMTLSNDRQTASLVSAVPNKKKVKPGETVDFTVTLQPYRKKPETLNISYTIPITAKEGPLTLDIHGGALVNVAQAIANQNPLITPTENHDVAKSYSDKINEFLNTGKNNQIIIEPGAVAEPANERELKREIERVKKVQEKAKKEGKTSPSQKETKVDTKYIIDNVIHTTIDVDKI